MNNGRQSLESSKQYHDLKTRMKALEHENQRLKAKKTSESKNHTFKILHIIENDKMMYLGLPSWEIGPNGECLLRGQFPFIDIDRYLQSNDFFFVVFKTYSKIPNHKTLKEALRRGNALPAPEPVREEIRLVSSGMKAAMIEYTRMQKGFYNDFPLFDVKTPIAAPYLFWYQYRSSVDIEKLPSKHKGPMKELTSWIEKHYSAQYDQADAQFKKGLVSAENMRLFVRPGDILVSKKDDTRAYLATSWLHKLFGSSLIVNKHKKPGPKENGDAPADENGREIHGWTVTIRSYGYVGVFYHKFESLDLEILVSTMDEEVDVRKLNFFPLRYASKETKEKLTLRGKKFWSCRTQKLISYKDEDNQSIYEVCAL
jgi:hypothetical protein